MSRERRQALVVAFVAGLAAPLLEMHFPHKEYAVGVYIVLVVFGVVEILRGVPGKVATYERQRAAAAHVLQELTGRQHRCVEDMRRSLDQLASDVETLGRVAKTEATWRQDLQLVSTTDHALHKLEQGTPGDRVVARVIRGEAQRTRQRATTAVENLRINIRVESLEDDQLFAVFGEETAESFFWATIPPDNIGWFLTTKGQQYQKAMDRALKAHDVTSVRRLLVYEHPEQLDDPLIALFMCLHGAEPYNAKIVTRENVETAMRRLQPVERQVVRVDVGIYGPHFVWETTHTDGRGGALVRGDLVLNPTIAAGYRDTYDRLWMDSARDYESSHYAQHGCEVYRDRPLRDFAELAQALGLVNGKAAGRGA